MDNNIPYLEHLSRGGWGENKLKMKSVLFSHSPPPKKLVYIFRKQEKGTETYFLPLDCLANPADMVHISTRNQNCQGLFIHIQLSYTEKTIMLAMFWMKARVPSSICKAILSAVVCKARRADIRGVAIAGTNVQQYRRSGSYNSRGKC